MMGWPMVTFSNLRYQIAIKFAQGEVLYEMDLFTCARNLPRYLWKLPGLFRMQVPQHLEECRRFWGDPGVGSLFPNR